VLRDSGGLSLTFYSLYSDRPNPNDHAESHPSHQAKQTDGKCYILAGTLRRFPSSMRCLCSLLNQTPFQYPTTYLPTTRTLIVWNK